MTDDEWENLYENFETTDLLKAVRAVDSLRRDLGDDEDFRPPELRINLLKLHEMAMAVVNVRQERQTAEMFSLAMDLEDQVSQMMEELEKVQNTLSTLVGLYPESLASECD